jgi:hypothetical protein
MKRRELIAFIGYAALSWSIAPQPPGIRGTRLNAKFENERTFYDAR